MSVEVITKGELEMALKQLMDRLIELKHGQMEIITRLDEMEPAPARIAPDYIPALDYMKAVGIKRWKFDQLMAANRIKTIKKKRKIYVSVLEVKRFFVDPEIQ